MRHQPNALGILLALPLLAAAALPLLADEVHLKNGRTMLAERTEVQGDRLILHQNGNLIEIPLALVDRVVESAVPAAEPGTDETAAPATPRPAAPARDTTQESEDATDAGAADETAAAEEVPPEQTEVYWQDRVRAITEERESLDELIVALRREERAFLFSHRSTADTRDKIAAAQARQLELDEELAELRREARRLNVPPGWLRVR